jgi:small GTP-binding protein
VIRSTLRLIAFSPLSGVGKTSIVAKQIANVYSKEIGPTIGASFFTCKINLNETKVKMQLWDTAGQERFKAMAPMYYRNANAALLVFDVTNHTSFEEVKSWILELQRNVQEPMFLLLVGNKIDLVEQRAVSREEAFIYAQSIGAKFLETSVVHDQVINHSLTKAFLPRLTVLFVTGHRAGLRQHRLGFDSSLIRVDLFINEAIRVEGLALLIYPFIDDKP